MELFSYLTYSNYGNVWQRSAFSRFAVCYRHHFVYLNFLSYNLYSDVP